MRSLIRRWLAVLAVVAGIGAAASSLPAAAAPAADQAPAASASAHTQPAADWWL